MQRVASLSSRALLRLGRWGIDPFIDMVVVYVYVFLNVVHILRLAMPYFTELKQYGHINRSYLYLYINLLIELFCGHCTQKPLHVLIKYATKPKVDIHTYTKKKSYNLYALNSPSFLSPSVVHIKIVVEVIKYNKPNENSIEI